MAEYEGKPVHPDFDGHAERPFEEMTMLERLDWAWDRAVDLHWARLLRERRDESPAAVAPDADG